MNKLSIIVALLVPLFSFAQKNDWKSFSFKTKFTNALLKYSQNNDSADTLYLNGKKFYVLAVGKSTSCLGISGKKWEWTIQEWEVVSSDNGRRTFNNESFRDRFDVFTDESQTKILKIVRVIDGSYVKEYR